MASMHAFERYHVFCLTLIDGRALRNEARSMPGDVLFDSGLLLYRMCLSRGMELYLLWSALVGALISCWSSEGQADEAFEKSAGETSQFFLCKPIGLEAFKASSL